MELSFDNQIGDIISLFRKNVVLDDVLFFSFKIIMLNALVKLVLSNK